MMFLEQAGKVVLSLIFILVGAAGTKSYAQQSKWLNNGTFLIDNFQEDIVGQLPIGWYNRNGDHKVRQLNAKNKAYYHYKVMENNGNKFLRYDGIHAMHLNFPLTNRDHEDIYNINVYKTPILSWKWRVFNFPNGADVSDNGRNDAVASIYVVWDFGHVLFKKYPKLCVMFGE